MAETTLEFERYSKELQEKIKLSEKSIIANNNLLKMAEETLSLEEQKYQSGLNTIFEVQAANDMVNSAEITLVDLKANWVMENFKLAFLSENISDILSKYSGLNY